MHLINHIGGRLSTIMVVARPAIQMVIAVMPKQNRIASLRQARGWSQEELAKLVGTTNQQIGRLESGARRLTVEWMNRISRALGVVPADLLASTARRMIPLVGYVGAGAEVFAIDDHAKGAGLDEVECPWSELGPSTVAVRVRGESMVPAYYDGDLIFYESTNADFMHLLGKECVVALADGRMFVKQLRRTATGQWYLHSHNAEPILGINIEWASKVRLIQRAE
jgi:phage repressor protein C with HTH and peptisase S24 domain